MRKSAAARRPEFKILRFAAPPDGLVWLKEITDLRGDGDPIIDDKMEALYKYLRWSHAYGQADPHSRERRIAWYFTMHYHALAHGREPTAEERAGYFRAKTELEESNAEIRRRRATP